MSALTAFGGRLRTRPDGSLEWLDGTAEPRAHVATRGALAPSYRCITYGDGACYVQVPTRDCTDRHPRADLGWCANYPLQRAGYTEDDARVRLVPIADWDRWAAEPGGVLWDRADEQALLERARSLGWRAA